MFDYSTLKKKQTAPCKLLLTATWYIYIKEIYIATVG